MALGIAAWARRGMLEMINVSTEVPYTRVQIYSGVRPAFGAAVTTQVLLAELRLYSTFLSDAPTGSLLTWTADQAWTAISPATAIASGVATWFRAVLDSAGTAWVDGDVGQTTGDLRFPAGTSITAGAILVAIDSWTLLVANP